MKEDYIIILKQCEKRAASFIKKQVMDKESISYGGWLKENELVQPKSTIYGITNLISLYHNDKSKYYKNENVYKRIMIAIQYVKKQQREDGTFDYLNCNFYAAPDTAFCVKRILPVYRLLAKYEEDEKSKKIREELYGIIKKAVHGIVKGGFHTPNHRWAIASVLMACYNIMKEEKLKEVALEYLKEGIDGNEYGEYAERSEGNYNRINNDAMIMLSEETGDESYLDYVERNLNMMLTYFEPDGSIFTNNSTRQDRGKKVYPRYYYFEYLYMAYKRKNEEFGKVARKIMDDVLEKGLRAPDFITLLMLHPELIEYEVNEAKVIDTYNKYYKDSGIIRVRRGQISYSIVQNTSYFLYFQVGALTSYMKIGVPYFDQREFKAQEIEKTDEGYLLKYKAVGWYYKPFKEKPQTNNWWQMDNNKREKIYGPDLNIKVLVKEIEEGIDVNIATAGCDRVPLKIELGFSSGSVIKTDSFICEGAAGKSITVLKENINISNGIDEMEVGPAFATHNFVEGNFGSEEKSKDYFTVYFADSTNFNRTITFKSV
ncbi:hypothetical protein [Clostridium hydrogenum]|uniref:hypothetical protein n=1 Tax=Clostridium hydrogenum TaxID=2855764 RepID=UPI001F3099CC|nr:hypothetical protein [Clostridium hydrogenum]